MLARLLTRSITVSWAIATIIIDAEQRAQLAVALELVIEELLQMAGERLCEETHM